MVENYGLILFYIPMGISLITVLLKSIQKPCFARGLRPL